MSPLKSEEILNVAVEASLAASGIIMEAASNPLIQKVKDRAQSVFISDSRVSDVEDPEFEIIHQAEALTFPNLGEFDEFRQVRFFHCQR